MFEYIISFPFHDTFWLLLYLRNSKQAMVGRHHQLNEHEFEQVWEMVEDSEAWRVAVHGIAELDMTEQLNNNMC